MCGEKVCRPACSCRTRGSPPHVRGKAKRSPRLLYVPQGSPPHMRGKAGHHKVCVLVLGITPAHAGKSRRSSRYRPGSGDHPRTCGEKTSLSRAPPSASGSPPRMRGKGPWLLILIPSARITPACAGKSRLWCSCPDPAWDHPRVCGEKEATAPNDSKYLGSPPRMRGKAVGHDLL